MLHDNSALPSWLNFDSNNNTFYGRATYMSTTVFPLTLRIKLKGTDYAGNFIYTNTADLTIVNYKPVRNPYYSYNPSFCAQTNKPFRYELSSKIYIDSDRHFLTYQAMIMPS